MFVHYFIKKYWTNNKICGNIYIEVKEGNNASCMVVDMILNVCDIKNGDYSEDAIRAYKYNDVIIMERNCKLYLLDSSKWEEEIKFSCDTEREMSDYLEKLL